MSQLLLSNCIEHVILAADSVNPYKAKLEVIQQTGADPISLAARLCKGTVDPVLDTTNSHPSSGSNCACLKQQLFNQSAHSLMCVLLFFSINDSTSVTKTKLRIDSRTAVTFRPVLVATSCWSTKYRQPVAVATTLKMPSTCTAAQQMERSDVQQHLINICS